MVLFIPAVLDAIASLEIPYTQVTYLLTHSLAKFKSLSMLELVVKKAIIFIGKRYLPLPLQVAERGSGK